MLDWLLDSDPSIRWQVLRDLAGGPIQDVAAERTRVATDGWGARLLALRGDDGQWAGGAYFPAQGDHSDDEGQPWTATTYTLLLLRDFGIDPDDDQVRGTVALVGDNCRWEQDAQPYFTDEVEPCINGMTVALGAYSGQDVEGVVARLLGEQLADGGWNCWTEYGCVRSSFATTINVLEGLLAYERATGGSAESIAARRTVRSTSWSEGCSGAGALATWSTGPGCSSRSRPAGTTTCSVPWSTSGPPEIPRTSEWTKRCSCSGRSSGPTAPGWWRTRIPAGSTSGSSTPMAGLVGGTR